MTVTTLTTEVSYTADGVQTDFPFAFQAKNGADIDVFVDGQLLLIGVIVTLNADQETSPGGNVNITPAPADQAVVLIKRNTPKTQDTDYDPYDPFPARTHENALDKLTLQNQEIDADVQSLEATKLEWVAVPASATATGMAGQVAYESGFLYVCVATDTWERVALATWV